MNVQTLDFKFLFSVSSSAGSTGYKFLFIEPNLIDYIINSLPHHSVTVYLAMKEEISQQLYEHPMAFPKWHLPPRIWIT